MDLILDEDMGCISGIEVRAGVGVEGSGVIGPREKNWCKIQLFSIIRDVNAWKFTYAVLAILRELDDGSTSGFLNITD